MIRIQKILLSLLATFVLSALSEPATFAYVTAGAPWPTDEPCNGSCAGKPVTIRYTIGNIADGTILMPNGDPLPVPLIRSSIEKGLWFWTTVANINFVEVPDGPLTQLRFRRVHINGPDPPPPADPIAKAQATCIGYGFGCEVQYDEGDRWQEVGTTANPDILGATIHEVGHIIGLHHTNVVGQNMYWVFHRYNGLNSSELSPANIPIQFYDDVAGVRSIYGAGIGSVTPIPEPTAAVLVTIAAMCSLPIRRRRAC